jgi:mannose-6-phosphate isomerase-like protein (cupin superfamily)
VIAGTGAVTLDGERTAVRGGDAIAIDLEQTKSFSNDSAAPLELMVVGIARDMAAKTALLRQPRFPRK